MALLKVLTLGIVLEGWCRASGDPELGRCRVGEHRGQRGGAGAGAGRGGVGWLRCCTTAALGSLGCSRRACAPQGSGRGWEQLVPGAGAPAQHRLCPRGLGPGWSGHSQRGAQHCSCTGLQGKPTHAAVLLEGQAQPWCSCFPIPVPPLPTAPPGSPSPTDKALCSLCHGAEHKQLARGKGSAGTDNSKKRSGLIEDV